MRIFSCIALLFASTLPLVLGLGNCSSVVPTTVVVGRQQYTFGGLGVLLHPLVNSQPSETFYVRWDFAYLTERNRTSHFINGDEIGFSRCVSPSDRTLTLSPIPNPLEPGNPTQPCTEGYDVPCGALLSYIEAHELDCWMEKKVEPFFGATRTSFYVHYTMDSRPGFTLTAGFHLVDKNVTIYPVENSTLVVNTYEPGILKITYEIDNMTWAGPKGYQTGILSDASWLEVWFNTSFAIKPGNLSIESKGYKRYLRYNASESDVRLLVDVDSTFILDGQPFSEQDVVLGEYFFQPTFDAEISLSSTVGLCAPDVGHWEHAVYDPSLAFLFTPAPSPSHKSNRFVPWGVVGVVLVLLALIVIGLGAVYAFIIKPRNRALEASRLKEVHS